LEAASRWGGGGGGGGADQTARDGDSGGARGHGGWIRSGGDDHGVAAARVGRREERARVRVRLIP
jgi:hypothetical protein